MAQTRPDWAVGFADETWWSRLARPAVQLWTAGDAPLRLEQLTVAKADLDPKALACYGLWLRDGPLPDELWLRFVDGRPVSALTAEFLTWCGDRLAAAGKTTLALVWDNASWHVSKEVRTWLRAHNQRVHREGGVRIIPCFLPTKSPWLNPIEPKWGHGKRRVVDPARLLTARELEERVCAAFACPLTAHLAIPKEVT